MESFNELLSQYDYVLPKDCIASFGVEPRDSAKLLVYNTKTDKIIDTTIAHLAEHLPQGTLVVLNDTKVLPVRLLGVREDGKTSEIFVLANEIANEDEVPVLLNRNTVMGTRYEVGNTTVEILRQDGPIYYAKFIGMQWRDVVEKYGITPLPHYIESNMNEEDARTRYQTVFAHESILGSVAAPTASLHITYEVLKSLEEKHIRTTYVTLHIGRGTFAPLKEEHVRDMKLHREWYSVPESTQELLLQAKKNNQSILTVGTTATRTLESFAKTGHAEGNTDIFIMPPYHFAYTTILMTNFHLPKTSLMMLVDAFLKHKSAKRGILDLYQHAIKRNYRFYSFGDAMLII